MAVLTPSNVRSFAGLSIVDTKTVAATCMGIYGTGGGGKTSILADVVNSPHGTPALLMDVEGGSTSVEHLRERGLDIVKPVSWNDILKLRNEILRKAKEGSLPYKAVIWDNLSEIATLCLKSVVPSMEGVQIQHWGTVNSRILEMVREQRDLARVYGIHTFFVFWEEIEKEELTGTTRKKVNLSPKLAAAVPGIITMLGRLTVPGKAQDDYIRKLSFAPSDDTDSKFRVSQGDETAKIPLELYLRKDVHFLVDFLATVHDGTPFPVEKYAKPVRKP